MVDRAVVKSLSAETITVPAGDVPNLISAFQQANRTPGLQVIELGGGTYVLPGPVDGFSGIEVMDDTVVNGHGSEIMRGGEASFRLVHIKDDIDVTWNETTFRGGVAGTDDPSGPYGGALMVEKGSMAKVNKCIFDGNSSVKGGAIFIKRGAIARIRLTQLTNNTAQQGGGAVFNDGGTYSLNQGYAFGNKVIDGNGGYGFNNGGMWTYINSTIAGAVAGKVTAGNGNGGAVYNAPGGVLRAFNTTYVFNTAEGSAGAIFNAGDDAVIVNSLMASNKSGEEGTNCGGKAMNYEYSLISDTTGCEVNGRNNKLDVDPKVSMPAVNGPGFIRTAAIASDSPAIGMGDPSRCESADARQLPRGNGRGVASCDVGAFQFHSDIDLKAQPFFHFRNFFKRQ
jgi:hypothetical protein